MGNLNHLTLVERDVLKRGLLHVLNNSKAEEFDAATRLNRRLDEDDAAYGCRLDRALNLQAEKLFNAEAIIKSVADAIEQRYGDDLDKAGTRTPNFPRALEEAVKLLRDCYANLETPTLEDLAEQLEKQEREAAEEEVNA